MNFKVLIFLYMIFICAIAHRHHKDTQNRLEFEKSGRHHGNRHHKHHQHNSNEIDESDESNEAGESKESNFNDIASNDGATNDESTESEEFDSSKQYEERVNPSIQVATSYPAQTKYESKINKPDPSTVHLPDGQDNGSQSSNPSLQSQQLVTSDNDLLVGSSGQDSGSPSLIPEKQQPTTLGKELPFESNGEYSEKQSSVPQLQSQQQISSNNDLLDGANGQDSGNEVSNPQLQSQQQITSANDSPDGTNGQNSGGQGLNPALQSQQQIKSVNDSRDGTNGQVSGSQGSNPALQSQQLLTPVNDLLVGTNGQDSGYQSSNSPLQGNEYNTQTFSQAPAAGLSTENQQDEVSQNVNDSLFGIKPKINADLTSVSSIPTEKLDLGYDSATIIPDEYSTLRTTSNNQVFPPELLTLPSADNSWSGTVQINGNQPPTSQILPSFENERQSSNPQLQNNEQEILTTEARDVVVREHGFGEPDNYSESQQKIALNKESPVGPNGKDSGSQSLNLPQKVYYNIQTSSQAPAVGLPIEIQSDKAPQNLNGTSNSIEPKINIDPPSAPSTPIQNIDIQSSKPQIVTSVDNIAQNNNENSSSNKINSFPNYLTTTPAPAIKAVANSIWPEDYWSNSFNDNEVGQSTPEPFPTLDIQNNEIPSGVFNSQNGPSTVTALQDHEFNIPETVSSLPDLNTETQTAQKVTHNPNLINGQTASIPWFPPEAAGELATAIKDLPQSSSTTTLQTVNTTPSPIQSANPSSIIQQPGSTAASSSNGPSAAQQTGQSVNVQPVAAGDSSLNIPIGGNGTATTGSVPVIIKPVIVVQPVPVPAFPIAVPCGQSPCQASAVQVSGNQPQQQLGGLAIASPCGQSPCQAAVPQASVNQNQQLQAPVAPLAPCNPQVGVLLSALSPCPLQNKGMI